MRKKARTLTRSHTHTTMQMKACVRACYRWIIDVCLNGCAIVFVAPNLNFSTTKRTHTPEHASRFWHNPYSNLCACCVYVHWLIEQQNIGCSDETKSNLFGHFCSMIFIWWLENDTHTQKNHIHTKHTMRQIEKWSTRLDPMTSLSCFFSIYMLRTSNNLEKCGAALTVRCSHFGCVWVWVCAWYNI